MTEVVLVAGPSLAGTSSVAAALRDRLPECRVLEATELAAGEAPAAVVFVVSATAPLAESDCAVLDVAATATDAVIGVVSKIDVHRTWRGVLDADRASLAGRDPRYGDLIWVGAAAAPDIGPPVVDELVATLRAMLADETLDQRNRLRAWENRLLAADRRLAALRERRKAEVRRFRLDRSQRSIAVRTQIQQARVALSYFTRGRCASARTELQEDVATMSRRRLASLPDDVRHRAAEVSGDIQKEVARQLTDIGEQRALAVEAPAPPLTGTGQAPLRSRGTETRLMMILGAGFGLGVALTLSRLFADLAPHWAIGGAIGGAAVGLAVTLWVVGVRGLLHDRAVLDRWIVEVTTGLRTAMEEWVAARVLAAEATLGRAAAERDVAESAEMEEIVARIDREIRKQSAERARAAAIRDRQVSVIESGRAAGRTDLDGPDPRKGLDYGLLNRSCE
ncbi:hypothetical protein ACTXG7_01345 [Mycolicibacterium sp. Dal123E01]|uniref:hypothetical protein n=1 Tax=Mycolicibacterium sp. Dal123E01 TaxID=3457578 RepID=UPI00403EADEC